MSDIFDQIASSTAAPGAVQAAAPSSVAQSSPPTAASAAPLPTSTSGSGDMFDQVAADPSLGFGAPAPPMPTTRPSSSDEFDQAQAAGGYSEPSERSGQPVTYLMQKPDESYTDFMKRAVAHGKTVTPGQMADEADQPMKLGLGVPARIAETAGGSIAALTGMAEALHAAGPLIPRATQALTWAQKLAAANPYKAMAMMAAINWGLSAVGLPKASEIAQKLELPALILLGDYKPGAEALSGETAAKEAASAAESAATGETAATATSAKETPEQFVDRVAGKGRLTVKPDADGNLINAQTGQPVQPPQAGTYRVWENGKYVDVPKNNGNFSTDSEGNVTDLRTAEQKAASVGQPASPKIIGRGANKGQPKTYKVFDKGQWVTVPVFK